MVYGIERYVHLARYEPANAANRTDLVIGAYDLATLPNEERSVTTQIPCNPWLPDRGRIGYLQIRNPQVGDNRAAKVLRALNAKAFTKHAGWNQSVARRVVPAGRVIQ